MSFRKYGSYRIIPLIAGEESPNRIVKQCFGNMEFIWSGDLIGRTQEDARFIAYIEAAGEPEVNAIEQVLSMFAWKSRTLEAVKEIAESRGIVVTSGVTETGTVELIFDGSPTSSGGIA